MAISKARWLLFSIRGRINRKTFWYLSPLCFLLPYLMLALPYIIDYLLGSDFLALLLFVFFECLFIYVFSVIILKRLHDVNVGFIVLIFLFPMIVIPRSFFVLMILLGALPGTKGSNRFGPEP